jgi:uncharacterized damage-inducible protein DinB
MTAEEARRHLAYTEWASRRILNAVLALTPEQRERDLSSSHHGVSGTLQHILGADRAWIHRVLGTSADGSSEPIEVEWPRIWKRWSDVAAGWIDSDLEREIDYKDMRGNAHRSRLVEIVMHVVNHATLHRGQIMTMLRQLGVPPPPTDLIFYYRETK